MTRALREAWRGGEIDRDTYLSRVREENRHLEEYAALLAGTDIAALHISDNTVTAESRWAAARFICNFDDVRTAPLVALALGEYETLEMRSLLTLLRGSATFFDVGANIGWYSIHARVINPNLRVIALEPVARSFAMLQRNVALNAVTISALHQGLSDACGDATIYVAATRSDASSMHPSREYQGTQAELISLTTLDDLVATIGAAPDVIKADVEGAELQVLRGGIKTLQEYHPAVLAEMLRLHSAAFGYHPNEIIDLMRGQDYVCLASNGRNWTKFEVMTEQTAETNFLFLHNERHREIIVSASAGNFPDWVAPKRPASTTPK